MINFLCQGYQLEWLAEEYEHDYRKYRKRILASKFCKYQLCSTPEGLAIVHSAAQKRRNIRKKERQHVETIVKNFRDWNKE